MFSLSWKLQAVKFYIKITSMKKWVLLFWVLCFLTSKVSAFELILPKSKKVDTTSGYAFFLGKASNSEGILINNIRVYTAPNGAFAHSVKLNDGENRIIVRSSYNTQIYRVYKKLVPHKEEEAVCEFETPKSGVITKDNIPVFSTPSFSDKKRLAHLFKDTKVTVIASKGDFYKLFLSKDEFGWIPKAGLEFYCSPQKEPPVFLNMNNTRYKNASVHTISFTENLPYAIEERENEIIFKVYNPQLSDTSVYTMNIPKPDKYTYQVSLKNGTYTFKVSELPKRIEECTIVIDAGHGGDEKGAVGALGDEEKDINLKIALELQAILKQKGANVVMTRECDGNISLDDRISIARSSNANIFISIHLNSIGNAPMNIRKNRGTSIYYYNDNAKDLAEILENSITKSAKTRKDRVRKGNYVVIRPADYAGVLVEAAYMTNPLDSMLYSSPDFAYNTAKGIADGILEFIAE